MRAADDVAAGYRLAPKAFRAAVAKVAPSLVMIETFGGVRHSGGSRRGQIIGISRPGDGPTTGLIVSADGYIVTSTYNFLKKPPVITVILRDGTQHVAELKGRDETRKICLLKIDGVRDLPVPELAPRGQLRVGQWAVSVGVGYGDVEPALSAGIISATERIFGKAVQTDANTSPANYGGPLVDIAGRVIGICVPLSPEAQNTEAGSEWYDSGIGFAVPLDGADALLAQLKEGKIIQPGRLGIQPKPAGPTGGVLVEKVLPGSPAAKAGLEANDEIVAVDGRAVIDQVQLRSLLGRHVADEEVSLKLKREGQEVTVHVKLAAGSDQPAENAQPMPIAIPGPKPDAPKR